MSILRAGGIVTLFLGPQCHIWLCSLAAIGNKCTHFSFRCHHWGTALQVSYMPEQIKPLGSSSCTCFLSPCKTLAGVSTPEETRLTVLQSCPALWDIKSKVIQAILQQWVTSSCILTLSHQEFVLRHKYRSWELLLSVRRVPFGAESDSFRKLSSSRIHLIVPEAPSNTNIISDLYVFLRASWTFWYSWCPAVGVRRSSRPQRREWHIHLIALSQKLLKHQTLRNANHPAVTSMPYVFPPSLEETVTRKQAKHSKKTKSKEQPLPRLNKTKNPHEKKNNKTKPP